MPACDGLNVLELGSGSIPASMMGMLLADNGARVLKLEPPQGDRLRSECPSGALTWNRGKESRVVDLRTPGGQDEARELIADADVVVEAFGAGVAAGWGLGYDALAPGNPTLVYCSIKGFGPTGAYAGLKAYEGVVAAKVGLFSRGDFGFRPGPIFAGAPMASAGTAHMAFAGTLAALMARERTGRGQLVEATIAQGVHSIDYFGVIHWLLAQRMAEAVKAGKQAPPPAGRDVRASRYTLTLPTRDGRWVTVMQMLAHQAQAVLRATGLTHTLDEVRFAAAPAFATAEDGQAWEDLLWERFREKDLDEWAPLLAAEPDIAFELAASSEEGLDHPQMRHNGHVVEIHDPRHGPMRQVGPIAAFERSPSVIERPAPAVGEHQGPLVRSERAFGNQAVPDHPLAGITIVELATFFAAPFATALAASLGARVIKVEDLSGDPMRYSFGPAETGALKTMEGKESIAVDLKTERGQTIVSQLVERADAFVVGLRPGVAERLNLGRDGMLARNPRLLYLHAAGYGTDGPMAHRPIYANNAGATAGAIHRQAGYWLDPERSDGMSLPELQAVVFPRLRNIVDGDAHAANGVFSALLLGLAHQQRTGEGQFAATSMLCGNAYAYSDDFNAYEGKPPVPPSDPEQYGLSALYRLYPAAEGWVFLAATTPAEWEALAGAIGRSDLLDDARFADAEARTTNDGALATDLTEALAAKTAGEWEMLLTGHGIGCVEVFQSTIAGLSDVFGHALSEFTNTDPVMRETGLVIEVDHPIYGRIVRHGLPVTLSDTPGRVAPSCLLGEHTQAILSELGLGPDEVADLVATEVVGSLDSPR